MDSDWLLVVSSPTINDLVVYSISCMAKQKGIIKLIGKVGDIVFYYDRKRGYLARKVTSVDAERIRTDPAFERVRENNAEFAHCAWMVKLLRAAFIPLFTDIADTRMTSRLMKTATTIVRTDTTNRAGLRRPEHGDVQLLQGFDFNKGVALKKLLLAEYHTNVDQKKKKCTVTITPTSNKRLVKAPRGATNFRLVAGMATIDFKTGNYILNTVRTAEIAVRQIAEAPIILTTSLPHQQSEGLFVTLGIEFLQEVNGVYSPLQGRAQNAMTMIHAGKILQPVEPATCLDGKDTDDIFLARGKRMVGALDLHQRGGRQRLAHGVDQRPFRQRITRSLEEQHWRCNGRQVVRPARVRLLRRVQWKAIEHNTT
jgi:hypothetical protein